MKPSITIKGAWAELYGAPMEVLEENLTVLDPKRFFNVAFRQKRWDGKVRLYEGNRFPAGLTDRVIAALNEDGHDVNVIRKQERAVLDLDRINKTFFGKFGPNHDLDLWEHQVEGVRQLLAYPNGVVKIPTGGGKCLAPETRLLMADGSVKEAQDVKAGDRLMGQDSEARTVLSVCSGKGEMYRIVPTRGDAWVCNAPHVLTLVHTSTGEVIDIPLNEYLTRNRTFKHEHKLFREGVDRFESKTWPLFEPYFVGLWLGDGTKARYSGQLDQVTITNVDSEVIEYLHDLAEDYGCYVNTCIYGSRAPTHRIVGQRDGKHRDNLILDNLRSVFPVTQRLPAAYLTASRKDRLELLAGLIDSDGYLHRTSYEIIQKDAEIAEQVTFLARSLGFRALFSYKVVNGGIYHRVSISGDTAEVPVRIERKKNYRERNNAWKDASRTGFYVVPLGRGPYVGFTLDGNGRFLLEDFTVTHNTACEALIARFLWEERGWRTLLIVPRKGLARQAVKMFNALYDGDLEVGQCGDGKREVGVVTIGTAQTLIKFMPQRRRNRKTKQIQVIPPDPVLRKMVYEYEVLILDETHHASSETWFTIAMQSKALRRYGFSGTPLKNQEIADLRMIGATGEVVYTVYPKTLIEAGIVAKPKVCIVASENASGPVLPTETVWREIEGRQRRIEKPLPYQEAYRRGIVENDLHNHSVIRAVEWLTDHKKRTLVLCRHKDHWRTLNAMLEVSGIEYLAIWGATETDERDRAKDLLNKGKISVVLATTILDEGEDAPGIDAIVLAEGVKVQTNALQRIGRGMREKKNRLNEVWVVDFASTCHPTLVSHAADRASAYDAEGYEVIVLEDWPLPDEEPDGELLPFKEWDLTGVLA